MSWQHRDVDMVVWLGVNDVWPSHTIRQRDGRHIAWEYEGDEPQDLIAKFSATKGQRRASGAGWNLRQGSQAGAQRQCAGK
jgi:hypothetical protein